MGVFLHFKRTYVLSCVHFYAFPNINRGELKLVIVVEEKIDHEVIRIHKKKFKIIILNKSLPAEIKGKLYQRYRGT